MPRIRNEVGHMVIGIVVGESFDGEVICWCRGVRVSRSAATTTSIRWYC